MNHKGLVRPANGFVMEVKQTKHAEFSFQVTKLISSDAGDSRDRYKPHNDFTSNRHLCPFCLVEIFEHAQNFP